MPATRRPVIVTLVLAVALILGAAGCSGAGGGDSRQEFIDAATADGTFDEETAGCIYDRLNEDLDQEQIDALLENFDVEPTDTEVAEAAVAAVQECLGG